MTYSLKKKSGYLHIAENNSTNCEEINPKSLIDNDDWPLCPRCAKSIERNLNNIDYYDRRGTTFKRVLDNIFRYNMLPNIDTQLSPIDNKCWGYIPLELPALYETLMALKSKEFAQFYKETMNTAFVAKTFLDAGCGIGNVMLMAHEMLMSAYAPSDTFPATQGVDFDPENLKRARVLLRIGDRYNQKRFKVIKGDLRTFKHYHKYNIIYYYVPLIDRKELNKFLENLYTTTKVGTVLITFGAKQGIDDLWTKVGENFKTYEKKWQIMIKIK